ncbi:MAG: aminopeptidase [Crocinitomicaceae bacterium]|nr:aminopeptidase [Crocinitomicaceae bacterium]
MELLKQLIAVRGASGDESAIKSFILNHIESAKKDWTVQPEIIHGGEFQDAIILVFGKPRTAIFAHIDTIGFTVGYGKDLIKIGGPKTMDGIELVGKDSRGEIETELMVIDEENERHLQYIYDRELDRGTILTFKPDFRINDTYVQSPYLDNRLGAWNALEVAKTLTNGIIVFSTYEEHGGGTVGYLGRYIFERYGVSQALISDITWVTAGVKHGAGVAISMRDSGIPRRSYLNRIIEIARNTNIPFQLEVESSGGSDGTALQRSDVPFDWCFIGAPEDHVHTPDEKVFLNDIINMVNLYQVLMQQL